MVSGIVCKYPSLRSLSKTLTYYKDNMPYNDALNIIGEIRNTDSVSADFIKVVATFYDGTNSTLGSDFTYTDPNDLDPGQSAPFEMNAGIFQEPAS